MNSLGCVLLVDDGELQEARAILETLGARVDSLTGEPDPRDLEPPYRLVVSNVRRASAVSSALREAGGDDALKSTWIALHGQNFLPLRDRLRRDGVDYLVLASVDSEVLRLLFLHALYGGPERRGAVRIPVGIEVGYALRHGEGTARLLDLTRRGCRLAGAAPIGAGMQVTLRFPSGLSAGRELELRGRIVRVERAPHSGEPCAAIRFEELDERSRECIEGILTGHAIGSRVTPLTPGTPSPPVPSGTSGSKERPPQPAPALAAAETQPPGQPEDAQELVLEDVERRGRARAHYDRKVTAQTPFGTHVLIGRDLSVDGMRIAPQPGLRVGSTLRLTIYGGPRQHAVVTSACVAHDEGEMGMVLSFGRIAPTARQHLEAIVNAAADVECLSSPGPAPERTVVTASLFDDDLDDALDALFADNDAAGDDSLAGA